jgi:uncharacterized membrane protein YbhN (UPF0104 family)
LSKDSSKKSGFRHALKLSVASAIFAACFCYIAFGFEWQEIWQNLKRSNLTLFLVSSIATIVVFWFLRALRWAFLIKSENLRISFFRLYLQTAVTIGLANFTPFQSGEALKVELLRKNGGERLAGYTFFLFEKTLDFFVLSATAMISVATVFGNNPENRWQPFIFLATFTTLLTGVLFVGKWSSKRISFFSQIALPSAKTALIAFLLTLASWLTLIVGWKFILKSVSVEISLMNTAAIISLTTVVGILSLVPGAIGVSEVSVAALLERFGYEDSLAQSGAVAMGVYSFVILVLALFHWAILDALNFARKKSTLPAHLTNQ